MGLGNITMKKKNGKENKINDLVFFKNNWQSWLNEEKDWWIKG